MAAAQDPPDHLSCPRCGRRVPIAAERRPDGFPFCSQRCRLLDLGAWIDGKHTIAGRGGADGQE
jgi:endogenous inhibitor of DNA gyrase (YacG/DUF329 family)